MKALRKSIIRQVENTCTKIALPIREGLDFVDIKDIVRVEADRSYSTFYLKDQKIVVSKPLRDFEELLNDCGFLRVHRSHIINLIHIKKYIKAKKSMIIMDDNSQVEVSPFKKDQIYSYFGL